MPNLSQNQRRHLAHNVRFVATRKHLPISELARAAAVDLSTMEKWLDLESSGPLIVSQDQLRRLSNFLGITGMTHLYACSPRAFVKWYEDPADHDAAPSDDDDDSSEPVATTAPESPELSDTEIREHLVALLANPLITVREAITAAARKLNVTKGLEQCKLPN